MEHATNIDEQTLINRITAHIRTGDRKSAAAGYAYFVKQYSKTVLNFVARMTDNIADAEELAQNAFVKAFKHLQDYEGRAAFLTWVSRIAYNETISHLKRRKLHFISIDNTNIPDSEVPDDVFSTGDEERIQQLETALDLLPPDEKMLVHLYYYDDKPFKEIAFIMDTDENTLRVRLHRIRRKLQGMMS